MGAGVEMNQKMDRGKFRRKRSWEKQERGTDKSGCLEPLQCPVRLQLDCP